MRATCGGCGREVTLLKNGTFRNHQAWLTSKAPWTNVQFPPPCAGVGRTPRDMAEGEAPDLLIGDLHDRS